MLQRHWFGLCSLLFWPPLTLAQTPSAPNPEPEKIFPVDPKAIELRRVENHWQIFSNRQFLKDFGSAERDAAAAVRLIRELNLTQYAIIPGAQPAFECWLSDGQAPRPGAASKTIIPFRLPKLKVEQVLGAWCLRDDQQVLYNFGTNVNNAKKALTVCRKFGFNELGVIGNPPAMTYLLADDQQNFQAQQQNPSALALASAVAQQGVYLPKTGYIGARNRFDASRLEVNRVQGEWCLLQGREILARFAVCQSDALMAYRQLQDARVNEMCYVGTSGIPLFLANGRLPTGSPLGVNRIQFRPSDLKVVAVGDNWTIQDATKTLFELGDKKADAELMTKVLKEMQADQILEVGQPQRGGLRVISKTR